MRKFFIWAENSKLLKIILQTLVALLSVFGFAFVLLLLFRYKPMPSENTFMNWEALNGITSIVIPLVVVGVSGFISYRIYVSQSDIQKSNVIQAFDIKDFETKMNNRINEIVKSIPNVSNSTPPTISEEELKEKAYKFVMMSGMTRTKEVAEYLDISKEKAFNILNELLKYERKISAGGQVDLDNIDGILWLSKRR